MLIRGGILWAVQVSEAQHGTSGRNRIELDVDRFEGLPQRIAHAWRPPGRPMPPCPPQPHPSARVDVPLTPSRPRPDLSRQWCRGQFSGDPALTATQAAAVDDRAQQQAFTQWIDDGQGGELGSRAC